MKRPLLFLISIPTQAAPFHQRLSPLVLNRNISEGAEGGPGWEEKLPAGRCRGAGYV